MGCSCIKTIEEKQEKLKIIKYDNNENINLIKNKNKEVKNVISNENEGKEVIKGKNPILNLKDNDLNNDKKDKEILNLKENKEKQNDNKYESIKINNQINLNNQIESKINNERNPIFENNNENINFSRENKKYIYDKDQNPAPLDINYNNEENNKNNEILNNEENNKKNEIINNEEINNNEEIINNEEINNNEENNNKEIMNDQEINEQNFKSHLKILLINIEAKISLKGNNVNINPDFEKLKMDISEIFKKENREEIIIALNDRLIDFLDLNYKDQKKLNILIDYLSKINDTNEDFEQYIIAVLDNVIEFDIIEEDKISKINNYIINYMKTIKKKKSILDDYKNFQNIIKYDEFINIILKINDGERIFMDNNATEYLLYLMKKSAMEKGKNIDELDLQKFLDFYDAKEKRN